MAAQKLSSRQQAQLAYLQTLPPKFKRMHSVIEQMASLQVDDSALRSFIRSLDQLKAGAAALSMTSLADTAGLMATMARRGGGVQTKVRGLRELRGSLKIGYEGALRQATTPDPDAEHPDPATG